MKIIISGGGIAGLTLGLTAKKFGHHPIIIQQRASIDKPSFGGGIGLWPQSQMVMQRLGILKQLQQHSMYMPGACYYNSQGYILGHPSNNFNYRFPVLCLQRQQLTRSLYRQCLKQGIQFHTNTSINTIQSSPSNITIKLQSGQSLSSHILIGTDGINSKIRNIIMKQRQLPQIVPYHCNYTYFRSVIDVSQIYNKSQWHKHAFQSWGQSKRFGYVPLKYPKVFWFVAIPIGQAGLQKIVGSHRCTQQQKQWILNQFQYWQAPINIKQLLIHTPSDTILRTDIHKVKNITSFPWQSLHKNILILGDAANATAPNLAQGAGLAIQSAWDLIAMVDMESKSGLEQYVKKRKNRASTVQSMADMVAYIGQLNNRYSRIRNTLMKNATYHMKQLQQRIFQQTVSYSVGGTLNRLYWLPPNIPMLKFHKNIQIQNCLLAKVIGPQQFNLLPQITKQFRASLIGYGYGTVSTHTFPLSYMIGLPPNMINRPFQAYCQTYYLIDGTQQIKWVRTFGHSQANATKYSTLHRNTPNLSNINKYGYILTQSMGSNKLLDIFRFGYIPHVADDGRLIYYRSCGLWVYGWRVPIPRMLLPTSQWKQKQVQDGWQFQGNIKMPRILGGFNLMRYNGTFYPDRYSYVVDKNKNKNKRVIIAGGTGMIGSIVAKQLYLSGYTVQILTRAPSNTSNKSQYNNNNSYGKLPFAKIHTWNPQQYNNQIQIQIDRLANIFDGAYAVINLSGQNPGSGLWNNRKKQKMVSSRVGGIRIIAGAINKVNNKYKQDKQKQKYIQYLQASAAGIYGNRNTQILTDNTQPGTQQVFRVQTCKKIQQLTKQLYPNACILRIGHVLSSQGGLFPNLQLASKLRASRFGSGGQYVPWVHIQDTAGAIAHIIQDINRQQYVGKSINIVSPNHSTYDQLLAVLARVRGRKACIIPVPERLLKLVLGQMASILFDSQRMQPEMLVRNGYKFRYGEMERALTSRECL